MNRLCRVWVVTSLVMAFGLSGCMWKTPRETVDIPRPPREFRAAWVATVANIDWPSEPGLPVEKQKEEAIAILTKCKELNLNAVVFQVRPQADALYKSDLEPWSYYLTGQQGKAPEPFYDPLEFWIDEAHARGLELHTWYNPYRANHPANKGEMADNSLVKARPEMVVKLGDQGYWWMDPALQSVQDHSIAVVMDVVKRYDIDGVHFDDYFYPYASYNDNKDFPDDASWKAYQDSGGKLSRSDWRRDAVNTFIHRLYKEIKSEKPEVQFGISPFGIWRPGNPPGIVGLDQYESLYADAKLWFNEGWVDYMTPQLYWATSRMGQSYPLLLGWWEEQNTKNRHLWPGLSITAAGGREEAARQRAVTETVNQIMITRGMLPKDPGNIFFSMKTLMRNAGDLSTTLADGPYTKAALVPPSPWLDNDAPAAPWAEVDANGSDIEMTWKPVAQDKPFLWVVYTEQGGRWSYEIVPAATRSAKRSPGEKPITRIGVSAVDRLGNESRPTVLKVYAAEDNKKE